MTDRTATDLPPAPPDTERDIAVVDHLRKAEYQILWLRWIGIVGWALILWRGGAMADAGWAWAVYAGGVAYTGFAHWRVAGDRPILSSARITTVGDPLLVTLMCIFTGGLASVFFPFYYFTLLAAVFRFGVRETLGLLALTYALAVLLYVAAPGPSPTPADLLIGLFYLGFSAALGIMLARWAQENLDLARDKARALGIARDRAKELARRLIQTEEDERRRAAADIHDRMSGHLFALRQGADRAHDAGLSAAVAALSSDVRTLMNEMHPTVLDDLGFLVAVEEYVAGQRDQVPFSISLDLDPALRNWHCRSDAMLFRILQEALLNVRKHAGAGNVSISFRRDGANAARLEIADDGAGFDPQSPAPGHFGVLTMRERAGALGGSLEVLSRPGQGARLVVRVPGGEKA
ncbi:sensor histidine kinase [Parvibaculum sp.]|uniref:sensor histidine kinase n=1 Tax=Parvibaculum sp. TaxID=2024848 RepID=UPI0034A017F8